MEMLWRCLTERRKEEGDIGLTFDYCRIDI